MHNIFFIEANQAQCKENKRHFHQTTESRNQQPIATPNVIMMIIIIINDDSNLLMFQRNEDI